MPATSSTLLAALDYAQAGQPVFSCDPATKQPLTRGGFKAATVNPSEIERLWRASPAAMIGAPVGDIAGAFVLDIDAGTDDKTGQVYEAADLIEVIEAAIGVSLPLTRAARTPRGGLHLWFKLPVGEAIGNRAGLLPRIDVRGTGGYVILPPSARADGTVYAWQDPAATIADPPAQLVDMILRRGAFGKRAAGPPREGSAAKIDVGQRKYALSALDLECRKVRSAGTGQRNQALHDAAANVAELVAAGALDTGVARGSIEAAARDNPGRDDAHQIEATIASGWQKGLAKPRDLSNVAQLAPRAAPRSRAALKAANDASGDHADAGDAAAACNRRLSQLPMTDMGNAERFAARHRDRVRWVDKNEVWAAYNGKFWAIEGAESLVEQLVYDTVRAIRDEAAAMRASGRRDKGTPGAIDDLVETKKDGTEVLRSDLLDSWAVKSEAHGKFSKIKVSARPMGLTIQPDEFDRARNLINVRNGTIELEHFGIGMGGDEWADVRLRPHSPADLITRLMPIDFDPAATSPLYDAFLARVQPDEAMRRFLHQWGGYNLTGEVSEQKLCFWHGRGANGKTTLVDTWAWLMGGYATSMPIESFLDQGRKKTGSDHTADLVKLVGARLVRTSEPEKGSKLAEALIKLITGNEPIPVREPYAKHGFDLDPAFKMTISGNHRPQINGTDDGIWRRVVLVPWDVQIPDAEKDRKLLDKLRGEGSGILNRLIEGMIDWRVKGLIEPPSVLQATARYRDDSDPLGRFLGLCVAKVPGGRVQSSKLYALFIAWTTAAGERPWSQMGFSSAMLDRGFEKKQSNTIHWLDIETLRAPSDFVGIDGRALDLDNPSFTPKVDDGWPD